MDNINFLNDVIEEVTIDVKGKSCKVLAKNDCKAYKAIHKNN